MIQLPHRRRPVRRMLLATLALVAPVAVAAGTAGTSPAQAVEPDPPFTLEVPDRYVAYGGGGRLWDDLGIALVAGDAPFELWLQRPSTYDAPITVTWKAPGGDVVLNKVPAPRLDRLKRFLTLEFDPLKEGVKSFTLRPRTCIGGDTVRVRPDAPARSPYPRYCSSSYSPFALGAVQGIQEGYAASPLGEGSRMSVPKGRYDVTVSISDRWANELGLDEAARTATQRLIVKDYRDDDGPRGRRAGATQNAEPQPAATEPPKSAQVDPGDLPENIPLPDLRSLPAFGFRIAGNGNFLQFSATVWNGGDSPLVVDGFRRPDDPNYMDAYQYFFDSDGNQLDQYVPVGGFEWDPKPTHQHWHFLSFARYSMVEEGHEPHPGDPGDHHVKSRKEAFCLAPTDSVDMTGPGADWGIEEADLGTSCGRYGSRAIREVLQAGWGDTYAQFRAGQSFNLKDLPRRACVDIVVEGNPKLGQAGTRVLVEHDYEDNTSTRTVCIAGPEGKRRITYIAPVGTADPGFGEHP